MTEHLSTPQAFLLLSLSHGSLPSPLLFLYIQHPVRDQRVQLYSRHLESSSVSLDTSFPPPCRSLDVLRFLPDYAQPMLNDFLTQVHPPPSFPITYKHGPRQDTCK